MQQSTAVMYRLQSKEFVGRYAFLRSLVDFDYHFSYVESRQHVQDAAIDQYLARFPCSPVEKPWCLFSAGVMGAGKSHTLHALARAGFFQRKNFVVNDPDAIKSLLPENHAFAQEDRSTAGTRLHAESALLSEIITLQTLTDHKNLIVDGSLWNAQWFLQYLTLLRACFTSYSFGVVYVTAERSTILERVRRRGLVTGRIVSLALLEQSMRLVPQSISSILASNALDYFVHIDNDHPSQLRIQQQPQQQQGELGGHTPFTVAALPPVVSTEAFASPAWPVHSPS